MVNLPPPIEETLRRSGTRTAASVITLLVVCGALTCGGAALWLFHSETGQELLAAASGTVEIAQAGLTAPGTDELRAAGCQTAMVVDFGSMLQLMAVLVDEEEMQAVLDEGIASDTPVVSCSVAGDGGISCQGVARVYVEAVAPTQGFFVHLQGGDEDCEAAFDATGELLPDE
jgi:hypothetical protein